MWAILAQDAPETGARSDKGGGVEGSRVVGWSGGGFEGAASHGLAGSRGGRGRWVLQVMGMWRSPGSLGGQGYGLMGMNVDFLDEEVFR